MNLAEYDAHRRTVRTPSGDISYYDAGTGRTALFIHGVGTNGHLWRNVVGELSERRCVVPDLPLHGRTKARDGDFTIGSLATAIEEFCDALELTDIDLVANDTGGAVAQIVAARRPERLATFTLTNCDTIGNTPPEAFKSTIRLARSGALSILAPRLYKNTKRAALTFYGNVYEDVDAVPEDVIRSYLEPIAATRTAARRFGKLLASLNDDDLRAAEPALRELKVPTLIVWATADVFFAPEWAQRLRDTIPGTTDLIEIEGARLFFPEERPTDLVPHLRHHWK